MSIQRELEDYGVHIAEKMLATQHHVGIALAGDFKKLGCIDSVVQKKFPTDLTLAGVLAYWEADRRGGAGMVLEELADLGKDDKEFEFHFPCGQLLLELGIDTWIGQDRFTNEMVEKVYYFNRRNKSRFGAEVHAYVGTAGNFLK